MSAQYRRNATPGEYAVKRHRRMLVRRAERPLPRIFYASEIT